MIEITNNTRGHAKQVRREAEQLGASLAVWKPGTEDMARALLALQDGYTYARMFGDDVEIDVRLRFLSELLAIGDGQLDNLVDDARRQGRNWAQIGAALGMTRQGARQRFGRAA